MPFVDYLLLRSRRLNRVALNIGGIANITILPANSAPEQVIAFDTGPGNMVIDQLVAIHTGGRRTYDRSGSIAASGTVNQKLIDELLKNPYFRATPPKSAGREQYGADLIEALRATGLPLPELIATATAFTARTIALAISKFAPETQELIAAGGGEFWGNVSGQAFCRHRAELAFAVGHRFRKHQAQARARQRRGIVGDAAFILHQRGGPALDCFQHADLSHQAFLVALKQARGRERDM